jgi:hypothetical protein
MSMTNNKTGRGRYALRVAAVLFMSLVIVYTVLWTSMRTAPDYFKGRATDYHILMHQYREIGGTHGRRNIVIGDSRGNCTVDPTRLGPSWLNLSLPGAYPLEGYVTLEKFLMNGNHADTLAIAYGLDFLRKEGSNFFDYMSIPYRFLDTGHLTRLESLEWRYGMVYARDGRPSSPEILYRQAQRRLRHEGFPLAYRSLFGQGFQDRIMSARQIERKKDYVRRTLPATRGHMLFSTDSAYASLMLPDDPDSTFRLSPFNRRHLSMILEMASLRGVRVEIIIPPLNQTTYDRFRGSRFLQTAIAELEGLRSGYRNVGLDTSALYLPDDCFADHSGHFNTKGVGVYTEILRMRFGMTTVANTMTPQPGPPIPRNLLEHNGKSRP